MDIYLAATSQCRDEKLNANQQSICIIGLRMQGNYSSSNRISDSSRWVPPLHGHDMLHKANSKSLNTKASRVPLVGVNGSK
ncbi:hypothetical protein DUNSADRAFT_14926 [Dunaliella salina]|uniref:Encoded protein n=1 Tax=Dunaliella salina TaxID=3046 RepID=A0ABQ7G6D6_DUNSA|nr:hypothetical protein DUNSADRAFT_14926 [Dunaliella salina]|eukprot:KAF5830171.1 hypothetical protein DUNSADRAFT_14926 [Dunaliella salina]